MLAYRAEYYGPKKIEMVNPRFGPWFPNLVDWPQNNNVEVCWVVETEVVNSKRLTRDLDPNYGTMSDLDIEEEDDECKNYNEGDFVWYDGVNNNLTGKSKIWNYLIVHVLSAIEMSVLLKSYRAILHWLNILFKVGILIPSSVLFYI